MTRAVNTALAGSGGVLQVVQSIKTDNFSSSSTSFIDVSGLSVSITPTSSSSKILIIADISVGGANSNYVIIQFVRNITPIYIGTDVKTYVATRNWYPNSSADNASMASLSGVFLDSPATTSATTYKVQFRVTGGTGGINRRTSGDDTSMASSITVMEIAG
jgi:hypothetical protein